VLKASGRSIPGLHLRDLLDLMDKRHPGLLLKFGGHAAAAGLSIEAGRFADFADILENTSRSMLGPAQLARVIETDGELAPDEFNFASADAIRSSVWGQAFPTPSFVGQFQVRSQRLVGEQHLKLRLYGEHWSADAMLFNHDTPLPERIRAVYRLDINEWNGQGSLQLTLDHWDPADDRLA
jgi:single-stranded-DNA-specific exonuclease